MGIEYAIASRGEYVHVQLDYGYEITPEAASRFWPDLAAACAKSRCQRVLVEGQAIERRMTTANAFKSGTDAARSVPGLSLAVCLYDYVLDELTTLFKTVAGNRGARVEFFSDRAEALRWLGLDPAKHGAG